MKVESIATRFTNDDGDWVDILKNPDGEGFLIRLDGEEWWIEDLGLFASEIVALAARSEA